MENRVAYIKKMCIWFLACHGETIIIKSANLIFTNFPKKKWIVILKKIVQVCDDEKTIPIYWKIFISILEIFITPYLKRTFLSFLCFRNILRSKASMKLLWRRIHKLLNIFIRIRKSFSFILQQNFQRIHFLSLENECSEF